MRNVTRCRSTPVWVAQRNVSEEPRKLGSQNNPNIIDLFNTKIFSYSFPVKTFLKFIRFVLAPSQVNSCVVVWTESSLLFTTSLPSLWRFLCPWRFFLCCLFGCFQTPIGPLP